MKNGWKKTMGKVLSLFLVVALSLGAFAGCESGTGAEAGTGAGGDATGDASGDGLEDGKQVAALTLSPQEYPRVDGSTATIPLSEAFASAVMDLPIEEARQYILHNTTHNAYVNLIGGYADIIFVTSPSEEELSYAREKGVELEVIPIVSEGFVFLTGRENSVESLTFEQIKDIYSGKIVNWKDVGGEDREIVAYQRPDNSGSQTGMYELVIPADKIMKAPQGLRETEMGGLVDAVAEYRSGAEAIGYSYYYYVTDMWDNDGVKLLKVDGVYPDKATIGNGSYPIGTAYYAVMLKNASENSNAKKLLAWILSEEGQKTAEEAGYVRLAEE